MGVTSVSNRQEPAKVDSDRYQRQVTVDYGTEGDEKKKASAAKKKSTAEETVAASGEVPKNRGDEELSYSKSSFD